MSFLKKKITYLAKHYTKYACNFEKKKRSHIFNEHSRNCQIVFTYFRNVHVILKNHSCLKNIPVILKFFTYLFNVYVI